MSSAALALVLAGACGSSDSSVQRSSDGGAGGDGGEGTAVAGTTSVGAGASVAGEAATEASGAGAAAGGAGGAHGGATGAGGIFDASGGVGGGAQAGSAGQGGDNGQAVQVVSEFGCFALSGDGWDMLASGALAVRVEAANTDRCGGHSISDNPAGLAVEATPTSIHFVRRFALKPSLSAGAFKLSFAADDAATFKLNGQVVAGCNPTVDIAECSASCQNATLPTDAVLGNEQVNTLEIELTNLLSVPAGGDDWGWTSILYSLCVTDG